MYKRQPYDTWAADRGLTGSAAAADADPDHDGLSNALEMVLGGEPNPANQGANSRGLLPVMSRNPAGDLLFTFLRKHVSLGATTLTFQWSNDLTFPSPNDVPVGSVSSSTGGVAVNVAANLPDADTDSIVVTVPAADAAGGQLYGRLKVAVP